jgi:hypothetical protein
VPAEDGVVLPFVGNAWDHDGPTSGNDKPADGTDIVVSSALAPRIDTSSDHLAQSECPADRQP